MAESSIEWTDYTFNPWEGCEKVSPGCKHCYAERRDHRMHGGNHWGPGSTRMEHVESYWSKPIQWQRKAKAGNYHARVFCGSLCDILERRSELDPLRKRVFDELVPATPNLIWLFLTKRIENAKDLFPREWLDWWPKNVMLGFTVENQEWLESRWEHWDSLAARVGGLNTFLSCEPLLGPLDFEGDMAFVNWVICGGESGPNARPMHPDWARSLQAQCAAAGVPFLFKQWGEWAPLAEPFDYYKYGHVVRDNPSFVRQLRKYGKNNGASEMLCQGLLAEGIRSGCIRYDETAIGLVGKHSAGRLLDGKEYNGLPRYWPTNVGLPVPEARK